MKKQYLLVSALTGALLAPLAVEQGIVPFTDTTTNVQAAEATGEDVSDRVTIEQIDAKHYRISGKGDVKAGDYIPVKLGDEIVHYLMSSRLEASNPNVVAGRIDGETALKYDSLGKTNKSYKLVFTPTIEKYNQSFEIEWNPTLAADYKKDIADQVVDSTINIGEKRFNVSLDNSAHVVTEKELTDSGGYVLDRENVQIEDGEQNFVVFLRFNADNQTLNPNEDGEYHIQITDSMDSTEQKFSEEQISQFNEKTEPLIDWSKDFEIYVFREKKGAYPRQLVVKNLEQGIRDGNLTDVSNQFDIQIDNENRSINIQFPEGETDDSYTIVFSSNLAKPFNGTTKALGLIYTLRARLPFEDGLLKGASTYDLFARKSLDFNGEGTGQQPKPEAPQGDPTANQPADDPLIIAFDQYIALNKETDLLKLAQAIAGDEDISGRLKIDTESLSDLPHTGEGATITPTTAGQYPIRYYLEDDEGNVIVERTITLTVTDEIGELQETVNQLQQDLADNKDKVNQLGDTMTELSNRTDGLETTHQSIQEAIQQLQDVTQDIQANITTVENTFDTKLGDLRQELTNNSVPVNQFDELQEIVNGLTETVNGQKGTLDTLVQGIQDLTARVDALEKNNQAQDDRLDGLDEQVANILEVTENLTQNITDIQDQLANYATDEDVKALDDRLNELASQVANLENGLKDQNNANADELTTVQGQLDDLANEFHATIVEINAKLDVLEPQVEQNEDDIAALKDTLATIQTKVNTDLPKQIQDILDLMAQNQQDQSDKDKEQDDAIAKSQEEASARANELLSMINLLAARIKALEDNGTSEKLEKLQNELVTMQETIQGVKDALANAKGISDARYNELLSQLTDQSKQFGTFVADLNIVLNDLSDQMASNDKDTKQAIQDVKDAQDKDRDTFSQTIDDLEKALDEQNDNVVNQLDTLKALVQSNNDDLTKAINALAKKQQEEHKANKDLIDDLKDSQGKINDDLNKRLDDLVKHTDDRLNALDDAHKATIKDLENTLNVRFNVLATNVQDLRNQINDLKVTDKALNDRINKLVKDLTATRDSLQSVIDANDQFKGTYRDMVDQLNSILEKFDDELKAGELRDAAILQSTHDALVNLGKEVNTALNDLKDYVDTQDNGIRQEVTDKTNEINQNVNELRALIQALREEQEKTKQEYDESVTELEKELANIRQSAKELQKQIDEGKAFDKNVEKQATEMVRQLNLILNTFDDELNTGELRDAAILQTLHDELIGLGKEVNTALNTLKDQSDTEDQAIRDELASITESLNEAIHNLDGRLTETEKDKDVHDQSQDEAIKALEQRIEELTKQLEAQGKDTQNKYDELLSRVDELLNGKDGITNDGKDDNTNDGEDNITNDGEDENANDGEDNITNDGEDENTNDDENNITNDGEDGNTNDDENVNDSNDDNTNDDTITTDDLNDSADIDTDTDADADTDTGTDTDADEDDEADWDFDFGTTNTGKVPETGTLVQNRATADTDTDSDTDTNRAGTVTRDSDTDTDTGNYKQTGVAAVGTSLFAGLGAFAAAIGARLKKRHK